MQIGSLFAGIGGFDLAARWMGWNTKWYSEIDPYARKIMRKHFPEAYNVGDITTWKPDTATDGVDLLCGGFPCQPVSYAGKRLKQDDPRWLWPHFARTIRSLRPRYVVVENVPGLRSGGMGEILGDLAARGYDAEWESLPACAFGAPHIRDRVWIVAYPHGEGEPWFAFAEQRTVPGAVAPDASGSRLERLGRTGDTSEGCNKASAAGNAVTAGSGDGSTTDPPSMFGSTKQWRKPDGDVHGDAWGDWTTELGQFRGMDDGVRNRVDRLRCIGSSLVPQTAFWIFQQITPTQAR